MRRRCISISSNCSATKLILLLGETRLSKSKKDHLGSVYTSNLVTCHVTYQCEVAIRDFSFSDNVTGFGLYLISLKIIFSVSVSFLMFPCSKKDLIRAYLDKVHISEKATKFCKIFTLLLTVWTVVKSKVKSLENFVTFSKYMNFTVIILGE